MRLTDFDLWISSLDPKLGILVVGALFLVAGASGYYVANAALEYIKRRKQRSSAESDVG